MLNAHRSMLTTDAICDICRSFPHVTEDVKWGNDLVFSIGNKMFCAVGLADFEDDGVAYKCSPERFAELLERDGFEPAPYLARAQWVSVKDPNAMTLDEARICLREAYEIVKAKLPKALQAQLM